MTVLQDEPLALRQLLWLDDELFVAVSSGLLPTSSTLLLLRPAQDADSTLAVRSEGLSSEHARLYCSVCKFTVFFFVF